MISYVEIRSDPGETYNRVKIRALKGLLPVLAIKNYCNFETERTSASIILAPDGSRQLMRWAATTVLVWSS